MSYIGIGPTKNDHIPMSVIEKAYLQQCCSGTEREEYMKKCLKDSVNAIRMEPKIYTPPPEGLVVDTESIPKKWRD